MTDDERAAALRFDKDVYDAACVLEQASPLDLNEFHFDQLAIISKSSETRAREAQKQAQLALVAARTAAPVQTKAAKRPAPETMEEFLQKHGKEPATYEALNDVFDEVLAKWDEMNERNKERNARLDALETRVLELEAHAAAARTVTHADR